MCGIVGYVGARNASEVVIQGLEKLEYRGYDSAGIAMINQEDKLCVMKKKGRLSALVESLSVHPLEGNVGIGHTRWATHGGPSDVNAHPHVSSHIAVVHNGIIENYVGLKKELEEKGFYFQSQTDTEVIAHLIESYYEGDLLQAIKYAKGRLKGSYALSVISSNHPGEIVAVRKESPLIVGIGENEYFIASDIPALLLYTRNVCYLENDEIVHIQGGNLTIYDKEHEAISKTVHVIEWSIEAASKNGYEHFMLKEIHDQPTAIRETLVRRLDDQGVLNLSDIKLNSEDVKRIQKIYIVACGTAFHAGLVGKYVIEKLAKIPVEADIASEFRYSDPFIDDHTLLIVVSQSGETADTLAAMKEAKKKGARILAITNVVGSSVAREADDIFYTWAGPEIAVASTKAYTAQLIALYMIAAHLGKMKEVLAREAYHEILEQIITLEPIVTDILTQKEEIKQVAYTLKEARSVFYLGRGIDYRTAQEGALKLKEISYIHTEAFAAGELKHGTIALIEPGVPVIAIMTQQDLIPKMISNIEEVRARGAKVIVITMEKYQQIGIDVEYKIVIPDVKDLIAPILAVVPTQLLAYYASCIRGNDVDKPRNLAKSVTVE